MKAEWREGLQFCASPVCPGFPAGHQHRCHLANRASGAEVGTLINVMGTTDPPRMMVKFRCPHCGRAAFVKILMDPQKWRHQDLAMVECEHCQGAVLL